MAAERLLIGWGYQIPTQNDWYQVEQFLHDHHQMTSFEEWEEKELTESLPDDRERDRQSVLYDDYLSEEVIPFLETQMKIYTMIPPEEHHLGATYIILGNFDVFYLENINRAFGDQHQNLTQISQIQADLKALQTELSHPSPITDFPYEYRPMMFYL